MANADEERNSEIKSVNSNIRVFVRFINISGRYAKILWLNYRGQAVQYRVIPPKHRFDINTYETHPWIAVANDHNERLLINFAKIYYPKVPINQQGIQSNAIRINVLITYPVYRLEELCQRFFIRKLITDDAIIRLPLAHVIAKGILRKKSECLRNNEILHSNAN